LIEPLRFQHLDRFNWIVIGGASKTSRTPKWAPPFTWIDDLVRQPRVARVKVYFKSNLFDGKRAFSKCRSTRRSSQIRPRPRRFFLPERRRAMIAVIAGIDRRSSSVGTEYVRRHLRLAFGAQGLRA
jgi:hypothetical protein